MRRDWLVWLGAAAIVCGTRIVFADVLILRDGTRVDGTLVSVRGDTIEFRERSGWAGGRTRTFDRSDVRGIQFDGGFDGGGNDGGAGGMRETTVIVQARQPWTDTGVSVRAGQRVRFSATGEIRWGPDRKDGPDGEKNSPRNQNRPIPDRNAAALIGRIGGSGVFFVGNDRGDFRMRDSGRLSLGVNDDYLQDNSGAFRVTVYY